MNAMGIRSLAIVAGIGVSFATNVNAVERSTKSAAKVQGEKTAFLGLPFFGGCNTGGCNMGGCGYGSGYGGGYGCNPRPACGIQPCYPRPFCGTSYPVRGGYARPYPYAMPAYSNPGYVVPGYGAPGYGVPSYGVPAYGVPSYGAPGYYGPYGMSQGTAPVINTSGYRSPVLPNSLDDPYFP